LADGSAITNWVSAISCAVSASAAAFSAYSASKKNAAGKFFLIDQECLDL
jgi:Trk-type K+ transport system membrane component